MDGCMGGQLEGRLVRRQMMGIISIMWAGLVASGSNRRDCPSTKYLPQEFASIL